VEALEAQAWPPNPAIAPRGHDPLLDPRTMVLVLDNRVISSLVILSKAIVHAGERFRASGLSAVVTDKAARGHGHGLRLVRSAHELIAASGADLAIFTCDRPLLPFYEKAGWQHLAGTVLVGGTAAAPLASDLFDKVALGAFFTEHGRRHAPAFEHARVELYPGEIDRLW
jgi:aminoglycoside 2'-N-acetyltransferase I